MKAQFKLRDSDSKSETSIRLVSYINSERLVYSIGESISPDLWDHEKQRIIIPRGKKELQDQCRDINTIIERANDAFTKATSELIRLEVPVSIENLKEELDKRLKKDKKSQSIFSCAVPRSFCKGNRNR